MLTISRHEYLDNLPRCGVRRKTTLLNMYRRRAGRAFANYNAHSVSSFSVASRRYRAWRARTTRIRTRKIFARRAPRSFCCCCVKTNRASARISSDGCHRRQRGIVSRIVACYIARFPRALTRRPCNAHCARHLRTIRCAPPRLFDVPGRDGMDDRR